MTGPQIPDETGMDMESEDMEMEETPETANTVDVPLSMLGGKEVSEGSIVRLRVQSVDQDNQIVTLAADNPGKHMGGVDRMAAEYEG